MRKVWLEYGLKAGFAFATGAMALSLGKGLIAYLITAVIMVSAWGLVDAVIKKP